MDESAEAKNDHIGILNLQGGIVEHQDHMMRLGVACVPVRRKQDLVGLAGLIIPGGESTCLGRLIRNAGLDREICEAYEEGLQLWGTCAGAILLAQHVNNDAPHLGLIDITISRNAFGSQLASFHEEIRIPELAAESIPLTFIRAPKITKVGSDVTALGRIDDCIIAAETENILVTVFHPELTSSLAFHRHFAHKCGLTTDCDGKSSLIDPHWSPYSWTRQYQQR